MSGNFGQQPEIASQRRSQGLPSSRSVREERPWERGLVLFMKPHTFACFGWQHEPISRLLLTTGLSLKLQTTLQECKSFFQMLS